MFEFACAQLSVDDEFTIDEGQSWHIVRSVVINPNTVIVETDDQTFELNPLETVIVK